MPPTKPTSRPRSDESLELFPSARGAPERAAIRARAARRAHAPAARSTRWSASRSCSRPGAGLRALVDAGTLPSLILWGPPGSGKTTIARLLAEAVGAHFEPLSAVTAGVKEIRAVVDRAQRQRGAHGALPRRDPSLQPRAAGRAAAARRARAS